MYFQLRVRGLGVEETFAPSIKKWRELEKRVKGLAEIYGISFVRENAELTRVEVKGEKGSMPVSVYPGGKVHYEGNRGTGQPEQRFEVWEKRRLTAIFGLEPFLKKKRRGRA